MNQLNQETVQEKINRKEKQKYYYDRTAKPFSSLNVNDLVVFKKTCIRNELTDKLFELLMVDHILSWITLEFILDAIEDLFQSLLIMILIPWNCY